MYRREADYSAFLAVLLKLDLYGDRLDRRGFWDEYSDYKLYVKYQVPWHMWKT